MLNEKEKFEIVFESLKESYKIYVDTSIKLSGIFLIVIGWFGASKNPLPLLCNNNLIIIIALVSTVLGAVAVIALSWLHYRKSKEIYHNVLSFEADESLFILYKITVPMLVYSVFAQFIMLFGVFFLIYTKYITNTLSTCS